MATQTNVPSSVQQSKSAVIQFPAPQPFKQLAPSALLHLRGRLHQLEEQLEAAEQSITHPKGQRGGGENRLRDHALCWEPQ